MHGSVLRVVKRVAIHYELEASRKFSRVDIFSILVPEDIASVVTLIHTEDTHSRERPIEDVIAKDYNLTVTWSTASK